MKTQSLLTIILITALPLSLFVLAINRLEAASTRNNVGDAELTSPKPRSDLSITKDVDDTTPFVGTQVIFTLRLDNAGPSDANGVIVNDLLPSGYTYVRDNGEGNYNPSTGIWDVGNVEQGATAILQMTAMVNASGNYTNIAEITKLEEKDTHSSNDQDSATTFPKLADLSITKDVNEASPLVGEQVIFTLSVKNGGPSDATGVEVNDLLPSGYIYDSDNGGGDYDPGTGKWDVGDIEYGATTELQITATVQADGNYTNTAQITRLNEFDPPSDNNQDNATTTPLPVADLVINKIASPDQVTAGDNLTFKLVVTNNGPSSATSVQVTDDLSEELQLIDANSTLGSCSGDSLIICNIGDLARDEVITVTIVVNVDKSASGSLENTGSVSSLTFDPPDGRNNSDTISIAVLKRNFLIYLPIFSKRGNFGEPNDQCETATAILVNEDNIFMPEDQNDWYQFDIASTGELVVELSNFLPMEGQLTVFRGASCPTREFLGINGNIAINKVLNLGTQPAGHYYIYVSNDAAFSSVPYTLRVNFLP